ncbi:MAG: hypothetical protein ACREOQ_14365 [Gemmatimonadales bacterium]
MHRLGMFRRWRPVAACVSLTLLAAACGGGHDGGTGPNGGNGQVAGDYRLAGAGGNAVPAVINSPVCGASEIDNGGLTLSADGTYQMQFNWRDETGPQFAGDHGSYKLTANGLQFTSEAWGDQFQGGVDGGTVWLTWDFCNDNQGPELDLTFSK